MLLRQCIALRVVLPIVAVVAFAVASVAPAPAQSFVPETVSSAAAFALTTDELLSVRAAVPDAGSPLGARIVAMTHRVYVEAAAEDKRAAPSPQVLQVVSWNVADPTSVDVGAADRVTWAMEGDSRAVTTTDAQTQAQLADLAGTGIYLLQEIRLPEAVALARALHRHLVWAPEFLEVGPKIAGLDPAGGEAFSGNAIVSRWPLSGLRVLRFKDQADWYVDQKKGVPLPEKAKDAGAKTAFGLEVPSHEIRPPAPFGGRSALMAKVAVDFDGPGRVGHAIGLVDIHLENHSKPPLRRKQMDELLPEIKSSSDPVIFGGDLNTFGGDGRVLTLGRALVGQVDTPGKVAGKAVGVATHFIPYAGWGKTAYDLTTWLKGKEDPTSVFNREHQLFDDVHKQLGVKPSDQRDTIGYKHTYSAPSPKGLAGATLDWLFLYDPTGDALYVSDAKTFERLVMHSASGAEERLSDHFPVRIEVPLHAATGDQ